MAGKKRKAKEAISMSKPSRKDSKRVSRKALTVDAKARHEKKLSRRKRAHNMMQADDWHAPLPPGLNGKLEVPKISSKYATYFEFADNLEKKKKLDFTKTNQHDPPPGFAFVPIGDPTVTNMCKEISREKDAMIFIVSDRTEKESQRISEHTYRVGYHFRETIVDEVRERVGEEVISKALVPPGFVEPIPKTQKEVNEQADKALRDLFPRIPNTDRQSIIDHAFKLGGTFQGEPMVGTQANIPLARRAQLATLAHIRHTHTRYDKLLKETSWANARRVVEPICLGVLLKWRGDEETGRDQLEEILREVVIITDSEPEDSSEDSSEEDDSDDEDDGSDASSSDGDSDDPILITDSPEQPSRLPPRDAGYGTQSRNGLPHGHSRRVDGVRPIGVSRELLANDMPHAIAGTGEQTHGVDADTSKRSLRKQEKLAQKGFARYRNALADAHVRRDDNITANISRHSRTPSGLVDIEGGTCAASWQHGKGKATAHGMDAGGYDNTICTHGAHSSKDHALQDYLVPSIEAGSRMAHTSQNPEYAPMSGTGFAQDRSYMDTQDSRILPRSHVAVQDLTSRRIIPAAQDDQSRVRVVSSDGFYAAHELSHAVDGVQPGGFVSRPLLVQPSARNDVQGMSLRYRDHEELPNYGIPSGRVLSQQPRDFGFGEAGYRASYNDHVVQARPNVSHPYVRTTELSHSVHQPTLRPFPEFQAHDVRAYESMAPRRRSRSPPYLPHISSSTAAGSQVAVSRAHAIDPHFVRSFSQAQLHDQDHRDDGFVVLGESGRTSYRDREDDRTYQHGREPKRRTYQQPLPRDLRIRTEELPEYRQQVARQPAPPFHGSVVYQRAGPAFIELD